jgi:hypothetical protein
LAGNVGYNYSIQGLTPTIKASVNLTTFLNGQYRVSVMKEDSRFAQIKVTREGRLGISKSFNPFSFSAKLFDGIAVFGIELDKTINITPFTYSSTRSVGDIADFVYRYDVESEDGVDAYEAAIRGNLSLSQKIAERDKDSKIPAVLKVIEKNTRRRESQNASKFEIVYLLKKTKSKKLRIDHSKVIIPDGEFAGEHQVKNGSYEVDSIWSTIFGAKERKRTVTQVVLDEERLSSGDHEGFEYRFNFFIDDNYTSGSELNKYVRKFNKILDLDGDDVIFPPVPKRLPSEGKSFRPGRKIPLSSKALRKIAWYGRSNFFARFSYSYDQVQKFMNYDERKMMDLLTRYFKLEESFEDMREADLNFHMNEDFERSYDFIKALNFYEKWTELKEYQTYNDLHKKLSRLPKGKYTVVDLFKIMKKVLSDEKVNYEVNVYNQIMGKYNRQGYVNRTIDHFTSVAQGRLMFDHQGSRNRSDGRAVVGLLKLTKHKDGAYEFSFNLNQKPQLLFFKLVNTTLNFESDIRKLIVRNSGDFKKGYNSIILNSDETKHVEKMFNEILKQGRQYTFSIASSVDGKRWGKVEQTRFVFRDFNKPEPTQDDQTL